MSSKVNLGWINYWDINTDNGSKNYKSILQYIHYISVGADESAWKTPSWVQLQQQLHAVQSLLRPVILCDRFYCSTAKSHLSNLLQCAERKHLRFGGCILYLKGADDRMMIWLNRTKKTHIESESVLGRAHLFKVLCWYEPPRLSVLDTDETVLIWVCVTHREIIMIRHAACELRDFKDKAGVSLLFYH